MAPCISTLARRSTARHGRAVTVGWGVGVVARGRQATVRVVGMALGLGDSVGLKAGEEVAPGHDGVMHGLLPVEVNVVTCEEVQAVRAEANASISKVPGRFRPGRHPADSPTPNSS